MFRKMPVLLLAMFLAIGVLYPWMSPFCKSVLYGISLSLKSLIIFVLPVVVFGLLFKTAVQISGSASKWIVAGVLLICLSNFASTMISFLVGKAAYGLDLSVQIPLGAAELLPAYSLSFPKWISNGYAMLAGLALGVLSGRFQPDLGAKMSSFFEKGVSLILKGFLYLIPPFIAGFVIKMVDDGTMTLILQSYGPVFALIAVAVFSYIALIYLFASRFQGKVFVESLKNMFPAAMVGFGSMSSAAAMPLTILGVEKNSSRPDLARSIIPATVNIHLIGDCFSIPISAFAILKSFGMAEPAFMAYLIFALYFVLAKFSVAAVPGGGILVMLPILETYLGFSPEMLSLATALYILFDPLITSANVLGNGGIAMAIGSFSRPLRQKGSGAQV